MSETQSNAGLPPAPAEPEKIEALFRNGSVTVVGVLSAFSLGFLTAWAANPLPWGMHDLPALALLAVGVFFQIWSLWMLLDYRSLELPRYRRSIHLFMIGLITVGIGVGYALAADVVMISGGGHIVEAPG